MVRGRRTRKRGKERGGREGGRRKEVRTQTFFVSTSEDFSEFSQKQVVVVNHFHFGKRHQLIQQVLYPCWISLSCCVSCPLKKKKKKKKRNHRQQDTLE
jgi:hypothetical protein